MKAGTGDPAVLASGLGKRYRSAWALRDCDLRIPAGRITALVGPNGAGKTTLLRLLAGLAMPSCGQVVVLGRQPGQDTMFLQGIGYLAQEAPLYRRLTVADHLTIGAGLNPGWQDAAARERLAGLGIGLSRAVRTLSGGERAQVALALAQAKRPRLLLLDEPVAALDPLARRDFLASLTAGVADERQSVIMSSHLLRDLEQVCDHIVLLSRAQVLLCDDIARVTAAHRMLTGPRQHLHHLPGLTAVAVTHTSRQSRVLVRLGSDAALTGLDQSPSWEVAEVGLEEIVLAYMAGDGPGAAGPVVAVEAVA